MRSRAVFARLLWLLGGLAVFVLLARPEIASACASCMNDNPVWQRKFPILLGFIGFPFVIFGVGFWLVRRMSSSPRPETHSIPEIQE